MKAWLKHLEHSHKVKITVTVGMLSATAVTLAILWYPDMALYLHTTAATVTLATNLIWVWE